MASKGYEFIPGKSKMAAAPTKVVSSQPKQLSAEEDYVLNLDPSDVSGEVEKHFFNARKTRERINEA